MNPVNSLSRWYTKVLPTLLKKWKLEQMMKYVVLSLMVIFSVSCGGNKNPNFLELEEEDIAAKELLQGIWLDDETESPLMRVEGDTIYYADSQSAPITFKVMRDTLYTYGNDTAYYKIDKQAEHIFWFHSITDNIIKLHKSEDPNDSLSFVRREVDDQINGTAVFVVKWLYRLIRK